MTFWANDKPAAADWWANDKPTAAPDDAPSAKRAFAEETSSGSAFKIAAGKTGDAVLEGLKQSGMGMAAIMSEMLPERLKRAAQEEITKRLMAQEKRQKENAAEYKNLEEAHPVTTALGEAAPMVAAPMLRVAAGPSAAIVNSAVSAAAPAVLEYGTAEERAKRAAIAGTGGAAGGVVAKGAEKVLGKAMKPVTSVESESLKEAIEAAGRLGIQLTPGQVTGNKALQLVESRLAKTPGSSGAMQEFQRGNDKAMSRAAARAMGETADEITPDVFARASQRIGGDFERLSAKTDVVLGDGFTAALASLKTNQSKLGDFADAEVDKLIAKGMDLSAKGAVEGSAYQAIRSSLSKKAKDAFANGNSELGQALKTVREAMDDAAASGLSAADRQGWEAARKQWAALKTLEKGNVVEGGKVSAGRVKEALRTARPKDYKEGRLEGELMDIAKMAEQFKPMADSGTAQNLFVQGILTGINPVAGAASVAAPWAAQKAMFSNAGRNYLTKGREVSPLERALMDRAARLSTLGAAGEYAE